LLLPKGAAEAPSLAPDGPGSSAYRFDTPEIKAANHRLHGFPTHQQRHTRAAQMVLEVGKARGEATVKFRQLNRRCGPLTDATTARIQTLSLEQLEALADALLDFTGPVDLAAWLADHTG
jgi:hypothetical protein